MILAALLSAVTLAAAPAPKPATLLAAGDIGSCRSRGDDATAALLARMPGVVAALGDLLYDGSYEACYGWARLRARTRPALGNHDYDEGAAAYFGYWGNSFGVDAGRGWYSYPLGAWHVVVLNSNCAIVGCGLGSPQERWLRADLARNRTRCTLAYWHHPRFSSGPHGSDARLAPLWQALTDYHADVVLSGHDHDYERFAPQTASGVRSARGIREFVVGTGGRSYYIFVRKQPNSVVRHTGTFGVLRLTLRATRYTWQFVPVAGSSFSDRGSAPCR